MSRRLTEARLQRRLLVPWLHTSPFHAASQILSLRSTGTGPIKAPRGCLQQMCGSRSLGDYLKQFDHTSLLHWMRKGITAANRVCWVLLCKRSCNRRKPSAVLHWQVLPAVSRVRKTRICAQVTAVPGGEQRGLLSGASSCHWGK